MKQDRKIKRLNYIFAGLLFIFMLSAPSAHAQRIRFNLGGAKFPTVAGDLSVSISVDTLTPAVIVGTLPDQSFRDDNVGAAFFGYYLTTGLRTTGQAAGTTAKIRVKAGSAETSGRSYYLLGNGTSIPTQQSNLSDAPASYTNIATCPRNKICCGPSWSANGVSGVNGVNCSAGAANIVAGMDVTQFVKVFFSDPPSAAIVSQINFAVVVQ